MKRTALAALALLTAAAVAAPSAGAATAPTVTVITRNLYVGANILPLATSQKGEQFEKAAGKVLDEVDATEPDARMKLMAKEIADARADFANLQEVTTWLTGPKDDPADAGDVRWDYLATLLKELKALGRRYYVAASTRNLDAEGPTDRGVDVRFFTGNVMLVRKGIHVDRSSSGDFKSQLVIPTLALGNVETTRGWNAVDFTVAGHRGRVVNAHPEAYSPDIRLKQTKELIKGPLKSSRQVILAGDLNTGPKLPKKEDRPPYLALAKAGFVPRRTPKPNCCFEDDLTTGKWDHVVDWVMTKPGLTLVRSFISGTATTPSGLHASDHGSVVSTLRLR